MPETQHTALQDARGARCRTWARSVARSTSTTFRHPQGIVSGSNGKCQKFEEIEVPKPKKKDIDKCAMLNLDLTTAKSAMMMLTEVLAMQTQLQQRQEELLLRLATDAMTKCLSLKHIFTNVRRLIFPLSTTELSAALFHRRVKAHSAFLGTLAKENGNLKGCSPPKFQPWSKTISCQRTHHDAEAIGHLSSLVFF